MMPQPSLNYSPRHNTVIAPELIECIAKFLPTDTDMFKFLIAIPMGFMTEALSMLKSLMLVQTSQNIDFVDLWCYPIELNRKLWPSLTLSGSIVNAEGVELLDKIISLYSTVVLEPPYHTFQLPLHSRAEIHTTIKTLPHFNASYDISTISKITLELHRTPLYLQQERDQLIRLFKNIHTFPKLHTLVVLLNDTMAAYLPYLIKTLKSSTTLQSLTLLRMDDVNPQALTNDFFKDLADLSKNLNVLILKDFWSPSPSHFCKNFPDCTKWLLRQYPSRLEFKYGHLSGITLGTAEYTKVAKNITGRDLVDFTIRPTCPKSFGDTNQLLGTLMHMKNLRMLSILQVKLDVQCCHQLAMLMPQLEEMTLDYNQLDDDCCTILAKVLPNCFRLKQLKLRGQMFTYKAAISIANALDQGSFLRSLDLSRNNIGNKGTIALSHAIRRLDHIKLTYCGVQYEGAMAICKVLAETAHTSIDLNFNSLTIQGVKAILSELAQSSCRLGVIGMEYFLMIDDSNSYFPCSESSVQFGPLPCKHWCDLTDH